LGRSRAVRSCGLTCYEYPGVSNSKSRRTSWTPHSTQKCACENIVGILLSGTFCARVSGQRSSAQSKAVLSLRPITIRQKGNRLRFRFHADRCGNTTSFSDALGYAEWPRGHLSRIILQSLVVRRSRINCEGRKVLQIPGAHEKENDAIPHART